MCDVAYYKMCQKDTKMIVRERYNIYRPAMCIAHDSMPRNARERGGELGVSFGPWSYGWWRLFWASSRG